MARHSLAVPLLAVSLLAASCYQSHEVPGPRLRASLLVATGANGSLPPLVNVGRVGSAEPLFVRGWGTELHLAEVTRRWDSVQEFWGPLSADGARVQSGFRLSGWSWHPTASWSLVGNDGARTLYDGESLSSPHWVRFGGGEPSLHPWPDGALIVMSDLDTSGDGWALGRAPATAEIGGVSLGGGDSEVTVLTRLTGSGLGPPVELSRSEGFFVTGMALLPDGHVLLTIDCLAGAVDLLGERIASEHFLARVDPEAERLVEHWTASHPLYIQGQGRDDALLGVIMSISDLRASVTLGDTVYAPVDGAGSTNVQLSWDGRGSLPRATRSSVHQPSIDDAGFWTSFRTSRFETTDAVRHLGPVEGDLVWARFAEDLSKAAIAVHGSLPRRELLSVSRVDRTIRVLLASRTPVQIGERTFDPLPDAEASYWLFEMSFDTGAVIREAAFGGPDPARVTLQSISLGASEELILLHEGDTDALSLRLVSLADGAARTLEPPRAEGVDCVIVPGSPGSLSGLDAHIPKLTLATTCESGESLGHLRRANDRVRQPFVGRGVRRHLRAVSRRMSGPPTRWRPGDAKGNSLLI